MAARPYYSMGNSKNHVILSNRNIIVWQSTFIGADFGQTLCAKVFSLAFECSNQVVNITCQIRWWCNLETIYSRRSYILIETRLFLSTASTNTIDESTCPSDAFKGDNKGRAVNVTKYLIKVFHNNCYIWFYSINSCMVVVVCSLQ